MHRCFAVDYILCLMKLVLSEESYRKEKYKPILLKKKEKITLLLCEIGHKRFINKE